MGAKVAILGVAMVAPFIAFLPYSPYRWKDALAVALIMTASVIAGMLTQR